MSQDTLVASTRRQQSSSMQLFTGLLARADIRVNGSRPCDIRIHNPRVAQRTLTQANLGLGESYMDGDWDCDALDQFFDRILRTKVDRAVSPLRLLFHALRFRLLNLQTARRAFQVGERHYDIGNDLYRAMLDERLTYTCGYWEQATTLEAAQEAKLDLICRKLDLQPGQRVLDIGCGWGGMAIYLARHFDCRVTGITLSTEQLALARERAEAAGVAGRTSFELVDYRNLATSGTQFDRIVSVGMFEHVGRPQFDTFFDAVTRLLTDDGVMLLHTIGRMGQPGRTDNFTDRYIFPGGYIPALSEVVSSSEKFRLIPTDVETLRLHYAKTLRSWYAHCQANRDAIEKMYDARFFRMWTFYLSGSTAAFETGGMCNYQIQYVRNRHALPLTRDYLADVEQKLLTSTSVAVTANP